MILVLLVPGPGMMQRAQGLSSQHTSTLSEVRREKREPTSKPALQLSTHSSQQTCTTPVEAHVETIGQGRTCSADVKRRGMRMQSESVS
jgi:hypothetical protein